MGYKSNHYLFASLPDAESWSSMPHSPRDNHCKTVQRCPRVNTYLVNWLKLYRNFDRPSIAMTRSTAYARIDSLLQMRKMCFPRSFMLIWVYWFLPSLLIIQYFTLKQVNSHHDRHHWYKSVFVINLTSSFAY
jgi:hypothetical protein